MHHHLLNAIIPATILLAAGCGASSTSPPRETHTPWTSAAGLSSEAARVRPPIPGSYAALGASETYGIGANPTSNGYAYHVAHGLGARHFVDLGIPGATLHQAYDTEISGALTSRPILATLFFGFNDIVQGVTIHSFTSDLHDLVVTLQQARARVLIIALPDLSQLPAVRGEFPSARLIIDQWNAAMRRVAQQTHAAFLNLATSRYSIELAHHPDYISSDGLHPSNRGHARLAQVILQTIQRDKLWNGGRASFVAGGS